MSILLSYQTLSEQQRQNVKELLTNFQGEVDQCSLHNDAAQIVLNDSRISQQRSQIFLDSLVEILRPNKWGTDLPISFPERNNPPQDYASRYKFNVEYDPNLR